MINLYFKNGVPQVNIEISVSKGQTNIPEDFSRSKVYLWLCSEYDKTLLSCETERGVVKAAFVQGEDFLLDAAVYDLKLLWVKDSERERRLGIKDLSKICMAEVKNAFAIASYEEDATAGIGDSVDLKFKANLATYGYDGLSAYETAVLYKVTTALSEKEWVQIRAGEIETNQIADKAITAAKIADEAITTEKIADGGVKDRNIADCAITTEKLQDKVITTDKLKDGAVTEDKLENGSIVNSKIASNSVTTSKIADKAVTSDKILNEAVTEEKLCYDAVTESKIKDESVTKNKIKDDSVTTEKLADGSVTNEKLADGAITDSKLADGSLKAYVVEVDERIDEFGERIDNEIERCEVAKENAELATDDANNSAAEAKAAKQEIEEYMKSGEYLGEVEMEIDDNGHVIVGKSFENWDINDKGHLMLSRGAGGIGMRDDYLLEQMKTILYNMNNIKSQFPDKFPPKIMYTEYEEPVVTLSYPVASYRGETIAPTILYSQKRLDHYDTDVIVESIITTGAVLTWYNTDGSNTGNVTVGMSETGKEKEVKTVRVNVTLNNKSVITPFTIKQAGNPNYSDIAAAQTFEELKEEVINKFDGMQDQLDDIVGTSDTTPEIDTLKEMTKKFEGMSKDTTLKQDMALKGEVDDDEGLIIR